MHLVQELNVGTVFGDMFVINSINGILQLLLRTKASIFQVLLLTVKLFGTMFVIDSNGNSATIIWMTASRFQLRVPFTVEPGP